MLKGLKYIGIVVGLVVTCSVCLAQERYLIVPLPDTIVAPTPLDQAVYTNTAEFFTPYIVNEINKTYYMHAPTVTDVRNKIKSDYWLTKSAAKAMDDFRRYYTLDFNFTKKVANLYNTNLVLLITSTLDANNYVMRRTWWTFFEIPGSSALDPAIKINIYGVLIDTDTNMIVWSKTYQKTISTVENRIVPIGYTPQTEQLQRIKDYSVYLAPRVAQSLQDTLLTAAQKIAEPNMIHTDYGSIDNVFTKRYRTLRKEFKDGTVIPAAKAREHYGNARAKYLEMKEDWEADRAQKAIEKQNQTNQKQGIEAINFLWFKNKNTAAPPAETAPSVINTDMQAMPGSAEQAQQTIQTAPAENIQGTQTKNAPVQAAPAADSASTAQTPVVQDKAEGNSTVEKEADTKTGSTQPPAGGKTSSNSAANTQQPKSTTSAQETKPAAKSKADNIPAPEAAAPAPSNEKPAVNIKTSADKNKDNIVKINNKKQTNTASGVNTEEPPVDALIYTQPTNYSSDSDYLPVKPRLREINVDDTVNSF